MIREITNRIPATASPQMLGSPRLRAIVSGGLAVIGVAVMRWLGTRFSAIRAYLFPEHQASAVFRQHETRNAASRKDLGGYRDCGTQSLSVIFAAKGPRRSQQSADRLQRG